MKQTVEEAAREYSVDNDCRTKGIVSPNQILYLMENAFKDGAEWQGKQSPWKIIERDSDVFATEQCLDEIFSNLPVLLISSCGDFDLVSDDDDIQEWRGDIERRTSLKYYIPIPSFDEIIEADKDVLQRMKGK